MPADVGHLCTCPGIVHGILMREPLGMVFSGWECDERDGMGTGSRRR